MGSIIDSIFSLKFLHKFVRKFFCHQHQIILGSWPLLIISTAPALVEVSMISHWHSFYSLLTSVSDSTLPCCSFLNAQIRITFQKCKLTHLQTSPWLPFSPRTKAQQNFAWSDPLLPPWSNLQLPFSSHYSNYAGLLAVPWTHYIAH